MSTCPVDFLQEGVTRPSPVVFAIGAPDVEMACNCNKELSLISTEMAG